MSDLSPPSPPSPPLSDRRRRRGQHDGDNDELGYHDDDETEHRGRPHHDHPSGAYRTHDDDADDEPRSAPVAAQHHQHHQQQQQQHNRGPTRSATPPRHTSTGAYQSTSPAQNAANGKERSLMDLLAKAASEIRVERRKVRQLLDDNERLKGEVASLKGRQAQAVRQQQSSSANKEITEQRNKYADLMTAHKAMSVELEQCKEQLQTWQARCKEQQRVLLQNQQQGAALPRSRAESPTTQTSAYAQRNGGRTAGATAGGSAGARQPSATAGAAASSQQYGRADSQQQQQQQQQQRAHSSRRSAGSAHIPFDAMASQGLARSPPRVMGAAAAVTGGQSTVVAQSHHTATGINRSRSRSQHADPSRPAAAHRTASPSQQNSSVDDHNNHHHHQREAVLAAEERQFNDLMLSRLRRAIAPAPTKEQMSEVVHAMVQELVKSAARNGLRLELKRVGNSAYQCGRRRLNLTVDSRRLVVKCGGGHVDMNEFVQRNHLWTAMENPSN